MRLSNIDFMHHWLVGLVTYLVLHFFGRGIKARFVDKFTNIIGIARFSDILAGPWYCEPFLSSCVNSFQFMQDFSFD